MKAVAAHNFLIKFLIYMFFCTIFFSWNKCRRNTVNWVQMYKLFSTWPHSETVAIRVAVHRWIAVMFHNTYEWFWPFEEKRSMPVPTKARTVAKRCWLEFAWAYKCTLVLACSKHIDIPSNSIKEKHRRASPSPPDFPDLPNRARFFCYSLWSGWLPTENQDEITKQVFPWVT